MRLNLMETNSNITSPSFKWVTSDMWSLIVTCFVFIIIITHVKCLFPPKSRITLLYISCKPAHNVCVWVFCRKCLSLGLKSALTRNSSSLSSCSTMEVKRRYIHMPSLSSPPVRKRLRIGAESDVIWVFTPPEGRALSPTISSSTSCTYCAFNPLKYDVIESVQAFFPCRHFACHSRNTVTQKMNNVSL